MFGGELDVICCNCLVKGKLSERTLILFLEEEVEREVYFWRRLLG
jgi:hypothetical protein